MVMAGLLWYDDDGRRPLAAKIVEAVQRYRERVGFEPTVCQLPPQQLAALTPDTPKRARRSRAPVIELPRRLRLEADEHLSPNYFLLGMGENDIELPNPLFDDYDAPSPRVRARHSRRATKAVESTTAPEPAPSPQKPKKQKVARESVPTARDVVSSRRIDATPVSADKSARPRVRNSPASEVKQAKLPLAEGVAEPEVTPKKRTSTKRVAQAARPVASQPAKAAKSQQARATSQQAHTKAMGVTLANPEKNSKPTRSGKDARAENKSPSVKRSALPASAPATKKSAPKLVTTRPTATKPTNLSPTAKPTKAAAAKSAKPAHANGDRPTTTALAKPIRRKAAPLANTSKEPMTATRRATRSARNPSPAPAPKEVTASARAKAGSGKTVKTNVSSGYKVASKTAATKTTVISGKAAPAKTTSAKAKAKAKMPKPASVAKPTAAKAITKPVAKKTATTAKAAPPITSGNAPGKASRTPTTPAMSRRRLAKSA